MAFMCRMLTSKLVRSIEGRRRVGVADRGPSRIPLNCSFICRSFINALSVRILRNIKRNKKLIMILWSSGQGFWLHIQRYGFDSRRYQIFWEVVGLERGVLILLSTTEELLERKNKSSSLENLNYDFRDPPRWPRDTSLSAKAYTNFADKRRSLGRYS
jgi:hypothetical protein